MLSALIILLTLAIDVYTDTRPNARVNHWRGLLLRLPSFAVAAWLEPWSLLLALPYWGLFDVLFGWVKHGKPLYLGTRSRLDLLQRRYPWLVGVKFMVGVGALIIYILI